MVDKIKYFTTSNYLKEILFFRPTLVERDLSKLDQNIKYIAFKKDVVLGRLVNSSRIDVLRSERPKNIFNLLYFPISSKRARLDITSRARNLEP